jgi:CheY-like chemotaxis protein
MSTVHPAALARNIEIRSSIPPILPEVSGDEGRLQQIVWNLLSNAVKFTPRGGTITVRLALDGSILRLRVRDDGKGIDPEFLPYVFEAFRQADSSTTRSHEGIGLGLSIVRSLVALHGGRIFAASEGLGHGATFTVELPVKESPRTFTAHGSPAERASAARSAAQLPQLRGITVLVVDDQQYTRDVVTAVFRRTGATVHAASSVREAVECLQAVSPGVVFCDIAMPVEDGYAFVREVRALPPPFDSTPIAALTAFGRPEDRQRALESGFDAYLKKPVEPQELAATALRLAAGR